MSKHRGRVIEILWNDETPEMVLIYVKDENQVGYAIEIVTKSIINIKEWNDGQASAQTTTSKQ